MAMVRAHPVLTVKGLAKYMTSLPAQQRRVLRDFKYPREHGQAQAQYYQEARRYIHSYHLNGRDINWLRTRSSLLEAQASTAQRATATRLRHNSRAIAGYSQNFARREFDVQQNISMTLRYHGVEIKVSPELHVVEDGAEKLIKLEFGATPLEAELQRIISQTMLEAATQYEMNLPSRNILIFDVAAAAEYRCARVGARMAANIEAACANVAAIWPTL